MVPFVFWFSLCVWQRFCVLQRVCCEFVFARCSICRLAHLLLFKGFVVCLARIRHPATVEVVILMKGVAGECYFS